MNRDPRGMPVPPWLRDLADAAVTATTPPYAEPQGRTGPAAAVLMLFGDGPRGVDLVLVERAAQLRSHAGQVAFPGGRQDEADAGPAATALREAAEETGLDPAGVDVLAELPVRYLLPSGYLVTPVLGWWRWRTPVHAGDPAETAAVHVVRVDDLLDPANRGRVRHPSGYVGPAFRVGRVLVWGFTAGLLDELFRLLSWGAPWSRANYFELPQSHIRAAGTGGRLR